MLALTDTPEQSAGIAFRDGAQGRGRLSKSDCACSGYGPGVYFLQILQQLLGDST